MLVFDLVNLTIILWARLLYQIVFIFSCCMVCSFMSVNSRCKSRYIVWSINLKSCSYFLICWYSSTISQTNKQPGKLCFVMCSVFARSPSWKFLFIMIVKCFLFHIALTFVYYSACCPLLLIVWEKIKTGKESERWRPDAEVRSQLWFLRI